MRRALHWVRRRLRGVGTAGEKRKFAALAAKGGPVKLHVGCGRVRMPGWINLDNDAAFTPDVLWDLRAALPVPPRSVRYLYNEHLIEHLGAKEGLECLREFLRVLEPGGVVRIATPDLERLAGKYADRDAWREQDWLTWPEYQFIKTRAEMFNVAMRWWGHLYVYDEEELVRRVKEAGFGSVRRCAWGASEHAELANLETRKDSTLILEASP